MTSLSERFRPRNAWTKWREEWTQECPERLASRVFIVAMAGLLIGLPAAAIAAGDLRAVGLSTILSAWLFSTLWTEHTATQSFWDKALRACSRAGFVVVGAGLLYLAYRVFAGN